LKIRATGIAVVCGLLLLSLLFMSCERVGDLGRSMKEAEYYEEEYDYEDSALGEPAPEMSKRAAPAETGIQDGSPGLEGETAALQVPSPVPEARKRVYSGYARLLVDSLEKQRERLFTIAEDSGGYVESVHEQTVVIRVPAESFHRVFAVVLQLGEVLEKREETYDVTEQFRDLEVRVKVLVQTRSRLYALLERTADVEERLKILREIRRLTEEIESLRGNLRVLEEQIAFSRITLELVPRLVYEEEMRDRIPFGWIADLDPLYVSLSKLRGGVELDLGEDFAVFRKEDAFRAESANGVRVRAGTAANDPRGNDEFWQRALVFHLEPYYRSIEELEAGPLKGVLLGSKDADPFYYLVCVHTKGRRIYVVEAFFPGEPDLKTMREPVLQALGEMKIR
jgi:hypothetical protein